MKKKRIIKISIISILTMAIVLVALNFNDIVKALNEVINKIVKPSITLENNNNTFVESELIESEDFQVQTTLNKGSGTENDPYMIYSAEDLVNLSKAIFEDEKSVKGVYFKQGNDISLINIKFEPIGTLGYPFEGVYDGGGFTISNLSINTTDSYQGLFGFVTGTVKNLTVEGTIKASTRADRKYSYSYIGGIVGAINNGAIIENCTSYVNVEGEIYTGGIVGASLYTDNMKAKGAVNIIKNCTNYGTVTSSIGNNNYTAGIIGYIKNDGSVSNCKNFGAITGNYCTGGIVGACYSTTIDNCINEGKIVEMKQFAGGIAGYSDDLVTNCTNSGTITGLNDTGGVIGKSIGTISNCINTGKVTGLMRTGGIAGYIEGSNFINTGTINIKKYSAIDIYTEETINLASTKASIINCSNSGEVTSTNSDSRVGGVVGALTSLSNNSNNVGPIMIGCVNSGKIIGNDNTGGVVGWAYANCTGNNVSYSYQLGNEIYANGSQLSTTNLNGTSTTGYWIGRFTRTAAIVKTGEGACAHYE